MADEDEPLQSVTTIAPQHSTLRAPAQLRALPGWLMWRAEQLPGEDKPRKIPYYADGGKRHGLHGSPEDRAKLVTFAAACAAAARRGATGVGLALLPDWGVTALDFDKCVGPDGQLPDDVASIVHGTYAEYSPSGEGVRAFVRGNLGNRKSPAKGNPFGFETFSTNGFVTFTGNVLPVVEVLGLEDVLSPVGDDLVALCDARFGAHGPAEDPDERDFMAGREPRLGLSPERMEELLRALDPDMGRDEWVRVGMALHHETEGDDTGFALWDDWSALGGKYPGEEGLRQQWDSFTRREGSGRRQTTMASVIKMAREAAEASRSQAAGPDELRDVAARAADDAAALPRPEGVATPEGFSGKYPVVGAYALTQREPGAWLVKGVLPQADLVVLYGASGSGKTFVAIDLAAAIARGVNWREQRTVKGRVVIIAAEGGGGVGKRIEAYCRQHNIHAQDLDIGVITAAPNFLQREEIGEVTASLSAAGGCDLVVVDTFAQVTPGANENGAEDMGLALANARALREATGATVLLVHHAGKDASRGARGWSGIKAAADAELEVIRHEESGAREIRVSKMKDGDDGLRWGFKLETLDVGRDRDGDVVTSCVVVPAEAPPPAPPDAKPRSGVQRLGGMEAHIAEMVTVVDPTLPGMPIADFIQTCLEALPAPENGKRDTRRQNLVRALASLSRRSNSPIEVRHGNVYFMT